MVDTSSVAVRNLPRRKEHPVESVKVEIRAAEGGDDAKLLVLDQAAVYEKFAKRSCL